MRSFIYIYIGRLSPSPLTPRPPAATLAAQPEVVHGYPVVFQEDPRSGALGRESIAYSRPDLGYETSLEEACFTS